MKSPLRINFRGVPSSEALETAIAERLAKLQELDPRITGCHVLVEQPHRRHRQGNLFHVRVDVTVPGGEIVARRDPPAGHAHEDPFVAVRDAFDAIRRQLQDHIRRQRGDVKHHEASPTGRVARVFRDEGYGFIATPEGRDVYFHSNSVLEPGFDRLVVGDVVRFAEESGTNGPQATSVRAVA